MLKNLSSHSSWPNQMEPDHIDINRLAGGFVSKSTQEGRLLDNRPQIILLEERK
jgi:hypothetical protein